ncbi:MAG TPA: transglutaminase family protein [Eudoraea sp.]|nr:transglutaminase family protein [Eudoraea sp.]
MSREFTINYKAENTYEDWVNDAYWQFLIIPEQNGSQENIQTEFSNSIHAVNEYSINGYGFKTIRVHPKQKFKDISFEASFTLLKKEVNPFDHLPQADIGPSYSRIRELSFRADFEAFLRNTHHTTLPDRQKDAFTFNPGTSIFENLQALNHWTYLHLYFKTAVTDVDTALDTIIENREGVCQDFTHLFCALARQNGIPARYVSGYLHQGNGYFGDAQMHAWAEAYIPDMGWVGFDPTNDLLASDNHIKVAHGKDYRDCSPLKGVVYTTGRNETRHSVKVSSQQ